MRHRPDAAPARAAAARTHLRLLLLEVQLREMHLLVLLRQWMLLLRKWRVLRRQCHFLLLQRQQLLAVRGLR